MTPDPSDDLGFYNFSWEATSLQGVDMDRQAGPITIETWKGIKSDSATIFRRFHNQNQIRFRNQKKTIPQPKKRPFRNQTLRDSATKIRITLKPRSVLLHSAWHRLQTPGGWGGVGGTITFLQLRSFFWHTCSYTQHGIVSRWGGGVGWGGDNNVLANNVLGAALVSSCPWFRNHPWFQNHLFWFQNHSWFRNHRFWFQNQPFLVAESSLVSESFRIPWKVRSNCGWLAFLPNMRLFQAEFLTSIHNNSIQFIQFISPPLSNPIISTIYPIRSCARHLCTSTPRAMRSLKAGRSYGETTDKLDDIGRLRDITDWHNWHNYWHDTWLELSLFTVSCFFFRRVQDVQAFRAFLLDFFSMISSYIFQCHCKIHRGRRPLGLHPEPPEAKVRLAHFSSRRYWFGDSDACKVSYLEALQCWNCWLETWQNFWLPDWLYCWMLRLWSTKGRRWKILRHAALGWGELGSELANTWMLCDSPTELGLLTIDLGTRMWIFVHWLTWCDFNVLQVLSSSYLRCLCPWTDCSHKSS